MKRQMIHWPLQAWIRVGTSRIIPEGEYVEVSSFPADGDDLRIYWQGHEDGQVGLVVPRAALTAALSHVE
jgi:hypothetical protein